jgi:hypothetical protein
VTITAPQPPAVVDIVNTYTPKPGDITVHKAISGQGAGLHGTVVVVAACEDGQLKRITIPAGAPGPASVTLNGVPAGNDCGVAELVNGSNAAVSVAVHGIPDGLFVLLPAEQRTISINDEYSWKPGALLVTKTIDGPSAAGRSAITLTAGCSNGAFVSKTFAPGVTPTPILIGNLPAGTTCRVEEPNNGAAPGVGDVTEGAPAGITIAPGAISVVQVHDTFVPVEVLAEQTTNGGSLARTGSDPRRLGGLGLALFGLGVALTLLGHARRRSHSAAHARP